MPEPTIKSVMMTYDHLFDNGKVLKYGPIFGRNPIGLFQYVSHYWVASKLDGVLACRLVLEEADKIYEDCLKEGLYK